MGLSSKGQSQNEMYHSVKNYQETQTRRLYGESVNDDDVIPVAEDKRPYSMFDIRTMQ